MAKKLILIRHGQSEWNLKNLFTGWADVDLTEQGQIEAENAGRIIADLDFDIDLAFTSVLKRAINTLQIILKKIHHKEIPIIRDWRLNERNYGALQGLNKSETAEKYGEEQVHIWRRSYDIAPPSLEMNDERHPGNDPRYSDIKNLPAAESLATTLVRVEQCWKEHIFPELINSKNILIAAHGNSLRALVKMLDNVSKEEITSFNIPTGVPLLYKLDDNLRPISREFLGDPKLIAEAMQSVANQAKQ
ncbi:MAG: 2,3-diphosphoglycerate-dependent phosphoglycerate mutase [Pseudomonadota bacterium]|nr:2,3-diphosphoglycerate-dependent phosphoglycerate mutase [Pseudomonadota bacterium]